MKSHSLELSIPTRAGRFIAHYSENGLAALDFPHGRDAALAASGHRSAMLPTGSRQDFPLASPTETALKKILAGSTAKNFSASRFVRRDGISEARLECVAENFRWRNEKLRRNRAANRQPPGCPGGRRRVRREPDSGFGPLPSRARREQKARRIFRRTGLETQSA